MKFGTTKSDSSESGFMNENQQLMVDMIKKHINKAIKTTGKIQRKYIDWIYTDICLNPGTCSLAECCNVLDLPCELIRIRMQFELFRCGLKFEHLDSQLPLVLIEEIKYFVGKNTLDIAKMIWRTPGIHLSAVKEHLDDVIALLKNNLIMINETENIWFTSRNPIEYKNLYWTKCWSFYD